MCIHTSVGASGTGPSTARATNLRRCCGPSPPTCECCRHVVAVHVPPCVRAGRRSQHRHGDNRPAHLPGGDIHAVPHVLLSAPDSRAVEFKFSLRGKLRFPNFGNILII